MSAAPTTAVVPPYDIFPARVQGVERVTPHLVRLTFGGDRLADVADNGYDQRIKLILHPDEGTLAQMPTGDDWYAQWRALPVERRPYIRTYTIRAVRPAAQEVDIDLVDHGDLGPASRFARSASLGDDVLLYAPHAAHPGPQGGLEFRSELAGRCDQLIVGDDTAVPAICSIVERLPAHARGLVCIEVEHAAAIQELAGPEGVRIEWCVRTGERGAKQLNTVRAWLQAHPTVGHSEGDSTVISDGHDSAYWEVTTDPGEDVPPVSAWIAGESAVVRSLRRVVVGEHNVPKSAVAFMGYWRDGHREC